MVLVVTKEVHFPVFPGDVCLFCEIGQSAGAEGSWVGNDA